MSQKNKVEQIHVGTGGLVARQNAHTHAEATPLVPPFKTTGNLPSEEPEVKPAGFAKASPSFKDVPAATVTDPKDQSKALAENTVDVKKPEDSKQ